MRFGDMMPYSRLHMLNIYLRGFVLVFLHLFLVAVLATWALQVIALVTGTFLDAPALLNHFFLSLCLMALFPGQTVWTYRIRDKSGRLHTIVGRTDPG